MTTEVSTETGSQGILKTYPHATGKICLGCHGEYIEFAENDIRCMDCNKKKGADIKDLSVPPAPPEPEVKEKRGGTCVDCGTMVYLKRSKKRGDDKPRCYKCSRKALRESPIGKADELTAARKAADEDYNRIVMQKAHDKKVVEEAAERIVSRVREEVIKAEQAQCLSIGQDLCCLIGMTMIEDQDKGNWLGEKLKPIIKQLQRGAGIDA